MAFRLFLVFILLACYTATARKQFRDLRPQDARVEFESDGGKLEVWGGKGSGVFEDANVAACRTTLKPRGLWLPSYVDSPCMQLVTRGSGKVGIIAPFGVERTVTSVRKGDVVAVPEGVVTWWYNDNEDDNLEIVGAANVIRSPQAGGLRAFHLAGGAQCRERECTEEAGREQAGYASVLRGFKSSTLARAWDMDNETVREILEGQNGTGIIRLNENISFEESGNPLFVDYIYRFRDAFPDLRVEDGGEMRELNSYKLPILKHLGLGMECMHLQENAMVSPNWFHDAHQVLYVVEGMGKLEIVYNNGERALATELNEGSLVVIPAFYPSAKIAGRDGFHYVSFVTSDRPIISYLAGRNSVYRHIPSRVLSRMFNIGEDVTRKIQQAHEREAVIFPGSASQDEGSFGG